MAKVVRYLFYCWVIVSVVPATAQDRYPKIQTFGDLISYLDAHTTSRFSYADALTGVKITVDDGVDLTDRQVLTKILHAAGIEVVVKGALLVFRKINHAGRTLTGYVRDAESGESLIGAYVVDPATGTGVTTNTFGFFSLTTGSDSVVVSFIGYGNQKLSISGFRGELQIAMQRKESQLSEVVISGSNAFDLPEMSNIRLSPERIKSLPVLMGETDILKTLQLLPGVQSGMEGSAGFHVRGGGPDQNLVLLDGVPVYNTSHLFGFFSVFNADAINTVDLIKGGFPARYGGRLSSIVDIQMKEGNLNKVEGEGAVGLVASKFTVSGPISKGKTSFMLSGRRTYLDLLTVPIAKAAGSNQIIGGNFWDLNAKINHIISPKDRIYLSFYSGRDNLYDRYTLEEESDLTGKETTDIRWGNLTSAFRWNHKYNDRLFGNLTALYSRYQFDLATTVHYQNSGNQVIPDINRHNEYYSNIRDLGFKADFDYSFNNDHQVKFGANFVSHTLTPGMSRFQSHITRDTTFGSPEIKLHELYGYAEDEISITRSTSANLGIHYSMAFADTKTYTSLQPRVILSQKIGPQFSVKGSYARMAQYIHLLVNSGIGLPTDLWVPSTDRVKPQLSDQVAFGIATTRKGIELSVEGYYKWMKNLIEYKDGVGFLDIDSRWENKIESGRGKSYGAEVFIEKKMGRSTGWISYTWSKSTRTFANLNFGNTFPYRYDRRHTIALVYAIAVNERVDFSAVWVYNTGNAITLPTSTYPKAS
ncbi:TonB-dependent receptor [Dawidia soli]|uniref:TonB-dependent receptor n=1 Tax=Dawidia soli TaxID=2782352 RepID=A0AAP2D9B2_9BACT|nr:carboxypeptidase-like regulatory domain-containing protein [Dawidia soli]MBT1686846.1 TonB-dependent receptor [Dawidia soli]